MQLNRDDDRKVALVSPMDCTFLVDLNDRANNTSGNPKDFYTVQILGSDNKFQNFYKNFCKEMGLNFEEDRDVLRSIDYLKRITYKRLSEYEIQERINQVYSFCLEVKKIWYIMRWFLW